MWVFVLHLYTSLRFVPFRRYSWFSVTAFILLVTLTCDLLTLELLCKVTRGMDNLSANFGVYATFHCRAVSKHAPDRRHDLIMLTFDIIVHVGACRSLYSIQVPSLKFVGLHLQKICAFFISALICLYTLTFDLSTCKWGHGSPVSWAALLPIFSLLSPSILDLGSDTGQTDGKIDRQMDWQMMAINA